MALNGAGGTEDSVGSGDVFGFFSVHDAEEAAAGWEEANESDAGGAGDVVTAAAGVVFLGKLIEKGSRCVTGSSSGFLSESAEV